jgi:TRAP-type C4-dicarboxylate transport system substrate-binding protein
MQIDFEGTWNTKYYTNAATMIASNHMMFPMIAVASARKWAKFSKEEADLIASVMKAQIDQLVASYARIDADYLAKIRTTKVSIVEAARPFFGPAIDTWYSEWRNKAPILKKLEQEAAKL